MLGNDRAERDGAMVTLTPLSLRSGVRAGAMGVRLLGGLNMLGVVGLRKGALGIPLRGAGKDTGVFNISSHRYRHVQLSS